MTPRRTDVTNLPAIRTYEVSQLRTYGGRSYVRRRLLPFFLLPNTTRYRYQSIGFKAKEQNNKMHSSLGVLVFVTVMALTVLGKDAHRNCGEYM